MKKNFFVISTIIVMLIVSRAIVRIIDAMVQIDNDIVLLVVLLTVVNLIIGLISFKVYKTTGNK